MGLRYFWEQGRYEDAIAIVLRTKDHHDGEKLAFAVLGSVNEVSPKIVSAGLEAFMACRPGLGMPGSGYGHTGWVHSLSHITRELWEHRFVDWIRRFNEAAFEGLDKYGYTSCLDRLVQDFDRYAKFDDDPKNFGITPEHAERVEQEYLRGDALCRIKDSPFESQEALLRWRLQDYEHKMCYYSYGLGYLVDIEGFRRLTQQLEEIGVDLSEFEGAEKRLLKIQIQQVEVRIASIDREMFRKHAEKLLESLRTELASM